MKLSYKAIVTKKLMKAKLRKACIRVLYKQIEISVLKRFFYTLGKGGGSKAPVLF